MSEAVRVLVVDDSRSQREMLVVGLGQDPEIRVVGAASSGMEALTLVAKLRPDVVTMDLRMPHMDGFETSAAILRGHTVPIVMVTGSVSRFDQQLVSRALELGILAVTEKPELSVPESFSKLCQLVRGMAGVKLVRRAARSSAPKQPALPTPRPALRLEQVRAVGIVASTGGPQVLEALLTPLPADFPLPILVVQHIAPGFAASLTDWLAPLCRVPVRLARRGLPLEPGVWFAGDHHLTVQGGTLSESLEMPVRGHRPSGTLLLRSLAREFGPASLGMVLTGMGEDGAEGLSELRSSGGVALAQDEASATIASMPRASARLGVDAVLGVDALGEVLLELHRLRMMRPG